MNCCSRFLGRLVDEPVNKRVRWLASSFRGEPLLLSCKSAPTTRIRRGEGEDEGVLILTEGTANGLRPPLLLPLRDTVARLAGSDSCGNSLVCHPVHPRPTSWHRVEHDGTSEWLLPKVPPFILIAFRLPSQPHATLHHFQNRLLSSPVPSQAVPRDSQILLPVIFVTVFASIYIYSIFYHPSFHKFIISDASGELRRSFKSFIGCFSRGCCINR